MAFIFVLPSTLPHGLVGENIKLIPLPVKHLTLSVLLIATISFLYHVKRLADLNTVGSSPYAEEWPEIARQLFSGFTFGAIDAQSYMFGQPFMFDEFTVNAFDGHWSTSDKNPPRTDWYQAYADAVFYRTWSLIVAIICAMPLIVLGRLTKRRLALRSPD